jgi:tripartite motif-containing protein 71
MTASPTTAPSIPEAQPAPTGGEVPPTAITDEEDDPRRKRKAAILLLLLGILGALLGLAIWYLLFRQPVPLPPIPATQVPHFASAIYGVERPTGIAVTSAGDRIYVTQAGNASVASVLDGNGNKLADMLPPTSTGADHAPVYVAIDPLTAEVYVSDRRTGDIYIYDANGTFQREFTPAVDRSGWQPMGLTFDKAGSLYVTDLGASPAQVVVFDREANVTRTLGATENLNFANGVAVDDAGYVYVTDSNNGRMLIYGTDDQLAGTVGRGAGAGMLGLPRGIAVDGQGRVTVIDTSGQGGFVYKTLQAGQSRPDFVGTFGVQGVGNGEFLYPTGISIDGHGRMFIADTSNDRIQLWNY